MILVDLTAWFIFVYLVYFVIYRFIIIFNSSKGKIADIEKREYQAVFPRELTVLIYSHNNSAKVKSLIDRFSGQIYDKEKYSLNVILDNCDSENIKILEIYGGARLWRINTDVKPIGKYKAFAWLLERIRAFENTNAFIFLDAECIIKNDFLKKINLNLNENAVLTGETITRKNFFLNKIVNLKNKINTRAIRHGRYYSSLGNIIDSDVLVIKQDILEKIEFEKTDEGFEEYEYSIKLKYFNIPVVYSADIAVHKKKAETLKSIAIKDYQKRYKLFKTFFNNFSMLFSKTRLSVKELILSLIYPSGTVFMFWSGVLIYISLIYTETFFSKTITINVLLALLLLKIISEIQAVMSMRGNYYDYYYLLILFFLSPVIYLRSVLIGFFAATTRKKEKTAYNASVINFEKHIVEAAITNGKKEFPCKLEISKSDENSRAVFIFKDKRLRSSKQPRISYAVEEISDKLKTYGFFLKVCSNCGYFYITESTAAHSDGEQGYCLLKNFKEYSKEKEYAPVWGACKNIIPPQARNYILQQIGLEKTNPKNRK